MRANDTSEDHPRPRTPKRLPAHESGVRRMMADARGTPYMAFRSLEEAKASPHGTVILEGDDGGQIYVVAHAQRVKCDEVALQTLLRDLDAYCWDDPDSAHVYYEARILGEAIPGGIGGARVGPELWIHEDLEKLGLRSAIEAVLSGQKPRIRPKGRRPNKDAAG